MYSSEVIKMHLKPNLFISGRYYIKLGHGSQYEKVLYTEDEVAEWYNTDVSADIKHGLLDLVKGTFPGKLYQCHLLYFYLIVVLS